jgi:hypothetical protein
VDAVTNGIAEPLPAAVGDADGPVSGRVFKVERAPAGEKIAYVRMFSGTVRTRDRVRFGRDGEGKVTAVAVFDQGSAVQRASVTAGEIGKLWGLADVQIGDAVGEEHASAVEHRFAPPTLEAVVEPASGDDRARLRVALAQLAEQDPLIDVRQDDERHEFSISLYGEVQKEVTRRDAGNDPLDVAFCETRSSASSARPAPARRSRSCTRSRTRSQPLPAPRRRRAGRLGHRVPARRRPPHRADVPYRQRTLPSHGAIRATHASGRPPRLAGHRLRGHDDALQPVRRRPALDAPR